MTAFARWSAIAAFALAILAGLLATLAGPGYATETVGLPTAFAMLRYATLIGGAAAVLGLAAIVLRFVFKARSPRLAYPVLAVIVGAVVVVQIANFRAQAQANPLHDVTTDLDNPPAFAAIAPRAYDTGRTAYDERAKAAAHPHPDWRQTHADLYEDIKPAKLSGSVAEALERAQAAGTAMGWEIVAQDPATGLLEATATTGWFAFKDDVVVRATDLGDGTVRVDARSVSRIGVSDVGANAARLRDFLGRLSAE